MPSHTSIAQNFKFFYRYHPRRLVLLFIITLLLGVNQGAGIVMLIPLLSLLNTDNGHTNESGVSQWLGNIAHKMGIELSIEYVLAIFIFIILLTTYLTYLKALMQSEYEQGFIYETRTRLFRKIISCDWLTINSRSKHNHIQVISNEIPKVTSYYYSLMRFTSALIIIGAHVMVSLAISVSFTLLVMGVGIVTFFLLRRFLGEALSLGERNIGVARKMLKEIDDFWTMVKQAKIHNSEKFYSDRFNATNQSMRAIQNRQSVNRAKSQLLFTLAGVVALVVIVYMGYKIDNLPLSSIFVLTILFARLFPLFVSANSELNMMLSTQKSVALVIEVDESLTENSLRQQQHTGASTINGSICLSDVSFSYNGERNILSHLNLTIAPNSITGIVGASGQGKTTLIDLISGLLTPTDGFIAVGDTRLTAQNVGEWQSTIGYLPQDSFFVDGTIRENLIWDSAASISDEQIYSVLGRVNARSVVEREPKGLDTSIANYHFHFSGGERQRLALARVLLKSPKVLLLDEATSALDAKTEQQIMENLLLLKNELTILFVTHRQSLTPYFDTVIDLSKLHIKHPS